MPTTAPPVQRPLGSTILPAVSSGFLLGFSFPLSLQSAPFQGWLAFVAYVPLLLRYLNVSKPEFSTDRPDRERPVAGRRSRISAGRWFAEGLMMHLIAYAIAFHWVVFHPMLETTLASVGGVMGLALLASVPWALAASVARRGSDLGVTVWAVSAWALEHGLSYGSWALPWPVLSMTQGSLPHASLASVIGAPGLTAIVLFANAGAALALSRLYRSETEGSFDTVSGISLFGSPRSLVILVGVAAALSIASTVGSTTEQVTPDSGDLSSSVLSEPEGTEAGVRLLLVQPAIPAVQWARQSTRDNAEVLTRLTTSFVQSEETLTPLNGVDLVVWPESALTLAHFAITDSRNAPVPGPLLTGGILSASPESETAPPGPPLRLNGALLYSDRPSSPEVYAKHHLVPFAERVPGVGHLPLLDALAVPSGGVTAYERGPGPVLFSPPSQRSDVSSVSGSISFAPLICFETVVGPYVRQAARQGAGFLVGLSQVGWWGDSAVLPQYQILTALRAIETGRPIVVATVSGPSFTASARGAIQRHTRWKESTVRVVTASPGASTWYLQHAGLFHVLGAGLLAAGTWLLSAGSRRWGP